jgi:hypothetical protein
MFCLAIAPLTSSIQCDLNVWYLDDGSVGGSIESVLEAVKKVQEFEAQSGLRLNANKCEIFLSGYDDDQAVAAMQSLQHLLPGVVRVTRDHLQLLGSPLFKEGVPRALEAKKKVIQGMCAKLSTLSAHTGLFLLTHCVAVPKLMYSLRTSPTWAFPDKLKDIDELYRTANYKCEDDGRDVATGDTTCSSWGLGNSACGRASFFGLFSCDEGSRPLDAAG